jgi:hypothetical protein
MFMLEDANTDVIEVRKALKPCERCGNSIPKPVRLTWRLYHKRRFCSIDCSRGNRKGWKNIVVDNKKSLSVYIGENTQDGRLMADFYIGILRAIDERLLEYKGYKITPDMVKAAAEWLTYNYLGKPGQRKEEVVDPELTREEALAQLRGLESGG